MPSPVPVILITRVQGKVLAAIPFSFWHRSVARRKLPSQSFSKPASVSVGAVLDVDRENPLDGTFIKIWIGLLGEDLLQCLDFLQVQPFELENAFPTELDLPDHVPLAEALQSVADEKFSFIGRPNLEISARGGGADQSQRIARVEEALIEVKSTLQHLALGRAASSSLGAAPKAQPRVKFAASTQIPSENPIAGLDPHVVQSALRAGVSQGQLEELGRMLAGRKPDLADVARPSALRKTPRLDVLGESDEEAELSAPSAPKLTQAELDNPVQASLQKLTSILENLTSPTKKPTQSARHFRRFRRSCGGVLYFFQWDSQPKACSCASNIEKSHERLPRRALLRAGEEHAARLWCPRDWSRFGDYDCDVQRMGRTSISCAEHPGHGPHPLRYLWSARCAEAKSCGRGKSQTQPADSCHRSGFLRERIVVAGCRGSPRRWTPVWELHKASASRSLRGPSIQIAPGPVGRGHDVMFRIRELFFFWREACEVGKEAACSRSLPDPSSLQDRAAEAKGQGKRKGQERCAGGEQSSCSQQTEKPKKARDWRRPGPQFCSASSRRRSSTCAGSSGFYSFPCSLAEFIFSLFAETWWILFKVPAFFSSKASYFFVFEEYRQNVAYAASFSGSLAGDVLGFQHESIAARFEPLRRCT